MSTKSELNASLDTTIVKIAIASSGLGHIQRGIEAWAIDLAKALRRAGYSVTLFGGAPDFDATIEPLRYLRRTDPIAKAIASICRVTGGWRFGVSHPYDVEQLGFALRLWMRVRNDFDIVHVQDPRVAQLLQAAERRGIARPKIIFANGTGERPEFLRQFSYVQELSASAHESAQAIRGVRPTFMIPNFIDTAIFKPGDRAQARAKLSIGTGDFVAMTAAAIRKYHKRIDYLISEAARFRQQFKGSFTLLVVGAQESDTDELVARGKAALGSEVKFIVGAGRASMPELYQAADVFVLTSLFETFGIVLLEAMSTGLPVICHNASIFRDIAGPAGAFCELNKEGALTTALADMAEPEKRAPYAQKARSQVIQNFSETVVIPKIAEMYRLVLNSKNDPSND